MTTRKVWLLCCGILLAAAARAHCQEVGCSAGTCKPTQAPYYNQLADVIYPPPPACSEPVQWVRLFEAMANQRHGEQRWAPVAGPLTDDLRIQYRRDPEQDRVILHTMKELYWILAEMEGETIREQTAPCRDLRSKSDDTIARADEAVIVPDGVWIQGTFHLTVPGIDATAQRMTWIREKGQMLLEGNVVLELSKANHPAKILTERALINLQDGTYEVMPPNLENTEHILKPTSAVVPVTPAARGWR
jgi:hypothetical protein